MDNLTVSVVIPAYNSEKTILKTLQAVLAQDYPSVIDIIVVDDGSGDNTGRIAKALDRVQYIFQPNAGPASARNKGALAAAGEVIFFTDSDCVPHPNWISKTIGAFSDREVGVVSGSYGISNPENLLARCVHQEIIYRHQNLMPIYPKSFGSYNFGIRKILFEEVDGFNTEYKRASGEDNDLSYKVLKAGKRIYFAKDALVDHLHPCQVRKYLGEQYRHGYWRAKMYKDHPYMMAGDDYTFWKDSAEIIAVGAAILLIIGTAIFSSAVGVYLVILLLGMAFLEIIYGLVFTKNIFEGFFYSGVMFLRAFARAFGFSTGIARFLLFNFEKKSK